MTTKTLEPPKKIELLRTNKLCHLKTFRGFENVNAAIYQLYYNEDFRVKVISAEDNPSTLAMNILKDLFSRMEKAMGLSSGVNPIILISLIKSSLPKDKPSVKEILQTILSKIRDELKKEEKKINKYPKCDLIMDCFETIINFPKETKSDCTFVKTSNNNLIQNINHEGFPILKCGCGKHITTEKEFEIQIFGSTLVMEDTNSIIKNRIYPLFKQNREKIPYELTGICLENEFYFKNNDDQWFHHNGEETKEVLKDELNILLENKIKQNYCLFYQSKISWYFKHIQIDVGQGDSSLLLLKKRGTLVKSVLIDYGIDSYIENIMKVLKRERVNYLDAFILTHCHLDHMGCGFYYNCQEKIYYKNFKNIKSFGNKYFRDTHFFCPELYDQKGQKNSSENITFVSDKFLHVGIKGIFNVETKITEPKSLFDFFTTERVTDYGDVPNEFDVNFISVDNHCVGEPPQIIDNQFGVNFLSVDGHCEGKLPQKIEDDSVLNLSSIGLLIQNNGTNILSCGDLGSNLTQHVMNYLSSPHNFIKKKIELHVFKLNHHGSKYNNQFNFKKFKNSSILLLSAGIDNEYGHPDEETIYELVKEHNHLFCTNLPQNCNGKVKKELSCGHVVGDKCNIETTLLYDSNFSVCCDGKTIYKYPDEFFVEKLINMLSTINTIYKEIDKDIEKYCEYEEIRDMLDASFENSGSYEYCDETDYDENDYGEITLSESQNSKNTDKDFSTVADKITVYVKSAIAIELIK
ncbi:hypothetical protein QTN25_010152 [Entamoeba marina]